MHYVGVCIERVLFGAFKLMFGSYLVKAMEPGARILVIECRIFYYKGVRLKVILSMCSKFSHRVKNCYVPLRGNIF